MLVKDKIYYIWKDFHARCDNPRANGYERNGGRGIKVCQEWADLDVFREDVGQPPSTKHVLSRIDTSQDYTPENCKWMTRSEICKNCGTHQQKKHRAFGRYQTLNEWAREYGIEPSTLRARIHRQYGSLQQALETPVRKRRKISP